MPTPRAASAGPAAAEALVAAVEAALEGLGGALRQRDSAAIESAAQALQRSLERAVSALAGTARSPLTGSLGAPGVPSGAAPGLTPALRERLQHAHHRAAAQREALTRATAPIDRALQTLLPRAAAPVYGWQAQGTRLGTGLATRPGA